MKKTFTVLGLDPRISYSIVKFDSDTMRYNVLYFVTLNKDKFEDHELKKDTEIFDKNIVFLEVTQRHLKKVIELYSPDVIVSEDAFYHKFVTSYRLLTSWLTTVSLYLYLNHKTLLHVISPKAIKKIITGNANADKNLMRETLINNENVTWDDPDYLTNLTEHSVDAICCAIAKITLDYKL